MEGRGRKCYMLYLFFQPCRGDMGKQAVLGHIPEQACVVIILLSWASKVPPVRKRGQHGGKNVLLIAADKAVNI